MPRAEEEGEEMLQAMPENRPRQNPGSRFSRISVTTDKPQHGKGNLGNSAGKVLISRTGKDLIKGIGSCYTEDGPRKGHRLNYELRLSKESNAVSKVNFDHSNTLTITYTLTDN